MKLYDMIYNKISKLPDIVWKQIIKKDIIYENTTVNIENNKFYIILNDPHIGFVLRNNENELLKKIKSFYPEINKIVYKLDIKYKKKKLQVK